PIHDVVSRRLGGEHREAVVMARRDRDVPYAGALGERDPGVCVELYGIERRREPLVRGDGNGAVLHHPFALAELAVGAPVDEETGLGVAKPAAGSGALRGNVASALWDGA